MKYNCTVILMMLTALYADEFTDTLATNTPSVYIDCEGCDMDFIKTEIPFVNYVIDRSIADIYILITTQETAGEGTEYTITFIGQKDYKGMGDTLKYISQKFDSDDTVRRGLVKKMKLGLMRYVAKTSVAEDISITIPKKTTPVKIADKWHNWLFSIKIKSWLNGEQSIRINNIYGSFSADRITEQQKINTNVYYNYYKSAYVINDTPRTYITKSYGTWARIVRGVNEHWSAALGGRVSSSTYGNLNIGFLLTPAVEYNIFLYSQSTSRELRIIYKAGHEYAQYSDTTIYNKIDDRLFFESASITIDMKQRWGTIETTIEGAHYFHDFTKNHISIYGEISLPIVKGLTFNIYGQAQMLHDQLSISKKGLTSEEIILQIKQLETSYSYWASIGLTYSFGSLYSNIVNPRFGD